MLKLHDFCNRAAELNQPMIEEENQPLHITAKAA
jgi:hypothetical protein